MTVHLTTSIAIFVELRALRTDSQMREQVRSLSRCIINFGLAWKRRIWASLTMVHGGYSTDAITGYWRNISLFVPTGLLVVILYPWDSERTMFTVLSFIGVARLLSDILNVFPFQFRVPVQIITLTSKLLYLLRAIGTPHTPTGI